MKLSNFNTELERLAWAVRMGYTNMQDITDTDMRTKVEHMVSIPVKGGGSAV